MPTRASAILAFGCLAFSGPALAGAWTMPQGHGQVTLGALAAQASKSYDSNGKPHATPRYRKVEVQALLEYGVSDDFTVLLGPGFQHINIAAPTSASRTGAGYTEFGARYRFAHGADWVFSGQALVRTPGTSDSDNPAAIGYTGTEFDLRALFGKSFSAGGLPGFLDLQVGQRFRGGGPPDELRVDATLGLGVAPQWTLLAQSFSVISEGSGSSPLYTSYHYSKFQLSAVYDVSKNWSVQLGGYVTVLGRNALQENGLVAGIQYRF